MKILRNIRRKVFFSLQLPRIFFYKLVSSSRVSGRPTLQQPLQAVGRGLIEFHGEVNIGIFPSPYFFSTCAYLEARNSTAKISIGNGTSINNGFSAIADHTFIRIGERVLIGTGVEIIDSDFHGLLMKDRPFSSPERSKPVIVGDDVFLGSNVRICKGVTIGPESIIANGSIVVKDIPAGVIAAGNPAKVIRKLSEYK